MHQDGIWPARPGCDYSLRKRIFALAVSAAGMLVAAVAMAAPVDVRFHDVAGTAGIGFRYTFGDFTYDNILESSGSGVTVLDYDGDGYMDIYLLNGTYLEDISDPKGRVFSNTPNALFRNRGDGTFIETAAAAGLDDRRWSMAAAPLDYDGDGDVDVFVANYGANAFYRNEGNGRFVEVARELGLQGPGQIHGFTKWSVGAAWWDYDGDADADLFVGNFLAFDPYYLTPDSPHRMPHPAEYAGQASLLYRQGTDGRFAEATRAAGLYFPDSKCMGLTVFDFDGDGDMDLFQGNDHQRNFLFRNDGGGKFREIGESAGVTVNDAGLPTGSMHGSVGDVDGDGLLDLLVVDLRYGALYRNLGGGRFEDITASSGVKGAFSGKGAWAAAFLDYDNDGDQDIFSANGMADLLVAQEPLLLENDGTGRFRNTGPTKGEYFQNKRSGRGAAVWDYDNDGDLDILVSHVDLQATASLLRNDGGNRNHWLGLSLVGNNGPASALGATVHVRAGGRRQTVVNQPGNSYLSFHDPRIHIGLGDAQAVEAITIVWPGGKNETLHHIAADQYLTIVQGKGVLEH